MKKGLKLLVCVDWEGLSLEAENLKALWDFEERWAIPLLHFMNPAYFTSQKLKHEAKIQPWRVWFPKDRPFGLHLHGARHFVRSCQLPFRSGPCFSRWGDQNPGEFQGHEVMLHSYPHAEFEFMLSRSHEIFAEQGLPRPELFRAGGWMRAPEFADVLIRYGYWADSSSVPPQTLDGSSWESEPLQKYLHVLWGEIGPGSQPYREENGLWQIPNNGGAIDYWRPQDFHCRWQWARDLAEHSEWAVITLHQETAHQHIHKLDEFLMGLEVPVAMAQLSF